MAIYSEFSPVEMVICHSYVNVYQRVNEDVAKFFSENSGLTP